MLFRNPRVLPALMLCIGLGLAGIRGWQLRELVMPQGAELDQAVELNYVIDLARSRSSAMDPIPTLPPDQAAEHKARIRAELLALAETERSRLRTEFYQGLLLIAGGGLFYMLVLYMQRGQRNPLDRT